VVLTFDGGYEVFWIWRGDARLRSLLKWKFCRRVAGFGSDFLSSVRVLV
jgi:hypothetical protein